MNNIIQFPKTSDVSNDSETSFIIQSNMVSPEINCVLDELWNEIYIGKTIKNVSADEDGFIKIDFEWSKYSNYHFDSLIAFLEFTVNFINDNKSIISKFVTEYEEHLSISGNERLIQKYDEVTK